MEPSADQLCARVVQHLTPDIRIVGLAGPRMRAMGVESFESVEDFEIVGWSEVLRRLPRLMRRLSRVRRAFMKTAPSTALFVDAPGLHRRLLPLARRMGVRVVWLAPPQGWAWKRPSRIDGVEAVCLHAFEVPHAHAAGARACWFGCPWRPPDFPLGASERPFLAVLPGTREMIRRMHLPTFIRAASAASFGLGLQPILVHPADRPLELPQGWGSGPPEAVLGKARVALCVPGTGSLHAALHGAVPVVAGIPGRLDGWLARWNLNHGPVALPNRIVGKRWVVERLGKAASVTTLIDDLRRAAMADVTEELSALHAAMGPPGAEAAVARFLQDPQHHGIPDGR